MMKTDTMVRKCDTYGGASMITLRTPRGYANVPYINCTRYITEVPLNT